MIAFFVYNQKGYSGAAMQALLLAENLKDKVVFFNFGDGVFEKYGNIEFVNMPQSLVLQIFKIAYFTIKMNIKIFHLHGLFSSGFLCGFLLNKKVILKTTLFGEDDVDTLQSKPWWFLRKKLLRSVDINVVLSTKVIEVNAKFFGRERVVLVPNGCLVVSEQESKEKNLFLYVGAVCERKRTYESILYFHEHYANLPSAKMQIVGPYLNSDGINEVNENYVQKCLNYVRAQKLEDKVSFVGKVDKDTLRKFYSESLALIFLSESEGMPNVVLEAMSYNCVPILSPIDGVSQEILGDKECGFILSPPFTKAVHIEDILNISRKNLAQKRIADKFDIKLISRIYENLYHRNN